MIIQTERNNVRLRRTAFLSPGKRKDPIIEEGEEQIVVLWRRWLQADEKSAMRRPTSAPEESNRTYLAGKKRKDTLLRQTDRIPRGTNPHFRRAIVRLSQSSHRIEKRKHHRSYKRKRVLTIHTHYSLAHVGTQDLHSVLKRRGKKYTHHYLKRQFINTSGSRKLRKLL